ncbi:uncharacterized protein LOC114758012 [Neltuma alba]|uniref:uncharacterized protein LOC114745256 n=1 Tax=Neltuma alba TaxID=207710 RepID=UPI0010A3A6CC|nr:uncharacterized protein LOC114745256 [Prosopis alba]XP_028789240.1 uncharacterized protein LOC114745256 [Prosopis alba]XP_028789241.1 uncharacterized protein LOC114745256 [Prosopis alba]XP_028789243.1 uncharacterized protein LOC114745256 [Prosopis alba]XP_028802841.1 uncharacterized protein LOC114758012 [Prosopis alba]XP_028802842.1 uncharacterized protein LOC114758012 [Prosopis alba]XP_028802843.1 uncharacterized protein LOC114758012 [Prosopis alba]
MLKMENKQTVSAGGTQDKSMMKPIDQRAHIKGRSDILTRRLKNRERQRRYRARKRLEAETKKSSVARDITPITPQEEPQSTGNHNLMTRVYCNRDWKKDARRAHALKREEVTPNGSIDHITKLASEPEAARLASGKADMTQERESQSGSPVVVNNETPRTVLSRRDWKAEARKKKN